MESNPKKSPPDKNLHPQQLTISPGVLAHILGHIAFYCIDNNLPPLTTIVVGLDQGTPGESIPIDLAKLNTQRERVYATDWYNIYPPGEDELQACYKKHV